MERQTFIKFFLQRTWFLAVFVALLGIVIGGLGCSTHKSSGLVATPIQLNGKVVIPPSNNIPSSQLQVMSLVGQSSVNSDGSFNLNVVKNVGYQLLFVQDSSGNNLYLSYISSTSNTATIDAKSTAVALVLMHPIFWGKQHTYYVQIVNAIENDPDFTGLVQSVTTISGQPNYKLSDYLQPNSSLLATVNIIALSVAKELFSTQSTTSLNQSQNPIFVPLGPPPAPTSCSAPCPSTGSNVDLINPTAVYYGAGIYVGNSTSADSIQILDPKDGVILNAIIGIFTGNYGYSTDNQQFNDGNYNISFSKDLTLDLTKPGGQATVQNIVYLGSMILSVVIDIGGLGSKGITEDIKEFASGAATCLMDDTIRTEANTLFGNMGNAINRACQVFS